MSQSGNKEQQGDLVLGSLVVLAYDAGSGFNKENGFGMVVAIKNHESPPLTIYSVKFLKSGRIMRFFKNDIEKLS